MAMLLLFFTTLVRDSRLTGSVAYYLSPRDSRLTESVAYYLSQRDSRLTESVAYYLSQGIQGSLKVLLTTLVKGFKAH